MNNLYNKNIQDVVIIFALLLLNLVLFNNVYASTDADSEQEYIAALTDEIEKSYNGPTCEQYNDILVQSIYGNNPAYSDEDYLNDLVISVSQNNETISDSKAGKQPLKNAKNVFFADAHGLRVINHREINKVIKSARIGASITGSPALLEFAKLNGIKANGRVLSDVSVKQVSIYLKRFLSENNSPKVVAFVGEKGINIEMSLANMIQDKNELNRFINQYQFELGFPGMLMDFTSVLQKARSGQINT